MTVSIWAVIYLLNGIGYSCAGDLHARTVYKRERPRPEDDWLIFWFIVMIWPLIYMTIILARLDLYLRHNKGD